MEVFAGVIMWRTMYAMPFTSAPSPPDQPVAKSYWLSTIAP